MVGTTTALLLPDPPTTEALRPKQIGRRRLASLRDRDFAWMLSGRLVTNVGNALGTALFLFFLTQGRLLQTYGIPKEGQE